MPNFGESKDIAVFLDLDDTLFRSKRKAEAAGEALGKPATVDVQGQNHSFMSNAQSGLWRLLEVARVIPTTARTSEALHRVKLPFDDLAICSAGAVILGPDGMPDAQWERDSSEARFSQHQWEDVVAALYKQFPRLTVKPVRDFGRIRYLSVRGTETEISECALPFQAALPHPLLASVHSRDILVREKRLGKEAAVQWVLAHRFVRKPTLILGAGDRLDDLPFLQLADFMLIPKHSQIAEQLR